MTFVLEKQRERGEEQQINYEINDVMAFHLLMINSFRSFIFIFKN